MTLNDEHLDDLLRQIETPSGLKASLLTIPDRDAEVDSPPQAKSWSALIGIVAALAASVVLYFAITSPSAPDDSGIASLGGSEAVAKLLADMEQTNRSIDSILQAQDASWNVEPDVGPILDSRETIATALSLSWQAAIDFGASRDSVQEDLQYVVEKYPDTAGAQSAQNLLQIN